MRLARVLLAAVSLTVAFAFASVTGAGATNSSSCTFFQGTTICTIIHGSHGSTDSHRGAPNSNGDQKQSSTCKKTGSQQTDTC
jgi:hypothetical protein